MGQMSDAGRVTIRKLQKSLAMTKKNVAECDDEPGLITVANEDSGCRCG